MKRPLLLLIVLFPIILFSNKLENELSPPSPSSAELQIDSLKLLIKKDRLEIADLSIIKNIQRLYQSINMDSSLVYADKEIYLAKKTGNQNNIATAHLAKSVVLWQLLQPDLAEKLLLRNIENKSLLSDSLVAESLFLLAKVEMQKKMPSKSFHHTIAASELYEKMKDSINTAACLSYIAGIHAFALGEPEKSIPYFEKALTYSNKKNERDVVRLFINYSTALVRTSKFKEAIEKIRNAEILSKKLNLFEFNASIFIQYSLIYNETQDYKTSLKYSLYADSVLNATPNSDLRTREKVNWYLALNYEALGEYNSAIYYFKLLENSLLLDSWEIKSHLINSYKEIKNFEQAFVLQQELIEAIETIDEIARTEKLKDITEKYENDKKQQEIVTLGIEKEFQENKIKQQQFILLGIIGFFLMLISFGIYWYKTRMKLKETKQHLEKTQLQQRFLRTQLNPHFLFHALTSIESYIYTNDKIQAANFLRNFSKLMRNILEFSDVDFISLNNDIDFIKKYLELQQLSHDFKFNYQINISEQINLQDFFVPPMLIQPIVENAILHGAIKTKKGMVMIDYSKKGERLEIKISDNGEFTEHTSKDSSKLNRSMSLDITKKRIKNLHEIHGIEILYQSFISKDKNKTSSVVISIPSGFST